MGSGEREERAKAAPVAVRAKFRCTAVSAHHAGEEVYFQPVCEDHGVNKRWSEATPAGHVQLLITAKGAVGRFAAGKDYFLDFTEAPA